MFTENTKAGENAKTGARTWADPSVRSCGFIFPILKAYSYLGLKRHYERSSPVTNSEELDEVEPQNQEATDITPYSCRQLFEKACGMCSNCTKPNCGECTCCEANRANGVAPICCLQKVNLNVPRIHVRLLLINCFGFLVPIQDVLEY